MRRTHARHAAALACRGGAPHRRVRGGRRQRPARRRVALCFGDPPVAQLAGRAAAAAQQPRRAARCVRAARRRPHPAGHAAVGGRQPQYGARRCAARGEGVEGSVGAVWGWCGCAFRNGLGAQGQSGMSIVGKVWEATHYVNPFLSPFKTLPGKQANARAQTRIISRTHVSPPLCPRPAVSTDEPFFWRPFPHHSALPPPLFHIWKL
eukprot:352917-Chlamydomonas_euryale.AAC.8